LAGIYGMNFNHMLERAYHNAYFVSLGGMLLFVIISSIFFTENDGLKTSLSY
jgi:Mg2+ and Co2+ transporter CorA